MGGFRVDERSVYIDVYIVTHDNFSPARLPYRTGMSGEHSVKRNDKFLGNKFEQLQLASKT
jgi:hypothetical protein